MSYQTPSPHKTASIKIVAIYALFGFSWIYGSDTVLGWLVHDPATMVKIAVIKGFLFIFCTAVLLYSLINSFIKQIIAERKQAETVLEKSEAKFATAFKAIPEALVITSMEDGRHLEVNDVFLEVTGLQRDEVIGHTSIELGFWVDQQQRQQYLEKLSIDSSLKNYEVKYRVKNNEVRDFELSSEIIEIDGKKCSLNFIRDITERKRLEEERVALQQQFQQAQKMESLGVLAGGIAHDFNNLLAVIIGRCSLVKLRPITAVDNIPQIETAAERAAALCQQMLAYAGKAKITKSQIHLDGLVDEMVNMTKSTIGQNVTITCDLASDISPIIADASQIRQITMNLIINAAEAIGESPGEIKISLAEKSVRSDQQEIDNFGAIIPTGHYVCLEVSDNGCGMGAEIRQRIFEPFYTTKFSGRGLGMSAVLGIIRSHNGALQLFSIPAKGTTFKVYLPIPLTESAEDQPQQLISPPTPWKGNGTVLLVEDEEEVIYIAELMLEELGFRVLKAYNGREGLERYQQNATSITFVITDIGMPIMNGYALIRELKKLKPELPIIISSGFGDVDITAQIPGGEIAGLINKPYNFDQLRNVIESVLDDAIIADHTLRGDYNGNI